MSATANSVGSLAHCAIRSRSAVVLRRDSRCHRSFGHSLEIHILPGRPHPCKDRIRIRITCKSHALHTAGTCVSSVYAACWRHVGAISHGGQAPMIRFALVCPRPGLDNDPRRRVRWCDCSCLPTSCFEVRSLSMR